MLGRIAGWLGPVMAAIVLTLVAIVVYRVLRDYRWADIEQAMTAMSAGRVARAALFAAGSYACLTFFDWIALRCVGKPLAWRRAALASFTSLSIGHNVGFAGLSSGAVRYRFYTRWGLDLEEVARLVIYCGITVALGLATVGGLSLMVNPSLVAKAAGVSHALARAMGGLLLVLPAAWIALTFFRKSVALFSWKVRLPSTTLAAAQVGAGTLNYLCVAASLHALLGNAGAVAYLDATAAYVLANTGVIASHVPGGIGVLEGIVLTLLPGASVLAALLMFRVVYYLVPLSLGLALLALSEVLLNARKGWPAQPANASPQKP
jgi:glycosyltransferase 2 family protein